MFIKFLIFITLLCSYFYLKNYFIFVLIFAVVIYELYNRKYYKDRYNILKKIINSPSLEDIEIDYGLKEVRTIAESMIALMSQLKIREQKLLYDSEYIEALLEMLDGVLITLSETDYIVSVNKFSLKALKLGIKEIEGKPANEIPYVKEIVEYINTNLEESGGELEIGDRIFTFKYKTLLGNLKDRIVVIRDITKARDLERIKFEMQKTEALKDFAYGVTHEIRNPLTPIKGLIQLLRKELSKNEKSSKYMDMVFKEIDRLDRKIGRLDRFIEDGKNAKEEVVIDEFLKEIVDSFRVKVKELKQAEISFESGLLDVKISFDREKMKEAIENILRNSYDAIKEGGYIYVKTYEIEGRKIIKIYDNGKGMSEEILKKIRNPLYTTKLKEKAMGMGLPIACQVITGHGGSIEFNSEYNKGTEIRIIFM